jgi:LAO/AO transport system kinase
MALKIEKSALRVQPPRPTPEPPRPLAAKPRGSRKRLSRQAYVDGILRGERTILAQAITLVESMRPDDADLAHDVLEACLPSTGNSLRVGITGVPGAGKSSLIEALGLHLIRECGEKVAVLAVDPSSLISGGSILGDKTRMEALAVDEAAFIRPSPAGRSLGGVARRTRETMLLCEAAGYRNIIVETVGVGQSETAVRSMVDFFLLLVLTGAGDELQGMKRGVMEMADLVAVNKADGANYENAARTRMEVESALHFFPLPVTGWVPRAVTCSAHTRLGITDLWSFVRQHADLLKTNGWWERVRRQQVKSWMDEIIAQELERRFRNHPAVRERLEKVEKDVLEGRTSSFRAAYRLLDWYTGKEST